jgi:thiamine biosynthesis protein ThiS
MIKVNDKEIAWQKDMTVSDVFEIMNYDYALIAVSVDGKFVSPKEYESYKINDGASIKAIHICHGG